MPGNLLARAPDPTVMATGSAAIAPTIDTTVAGAAHSDGGMAARSRGVGDAGWRGARRGDDERHGEVVVL